MAKFRKSNLELQPNQQILFNNDTENRIQYNSSTSDLEISGSTVSLFHDGNKALGTLTGGVQIFDTADSANYLQLKVSSSQMLLNSDTNGTSFSVKSQKTAGGDVTLISALPDGSATFYYAGNNVARTFEAGANIGQGIIMLPDSGTGCQYGTDEGDGVIYNWDHGGDFRIRGENSLGTAKDMFWGDPGAGVILYYAGIDVFETNRSGITLRNPNNDETQVFTGQDVKNLGDLVSYSPNNIIVSAGNDTKLISTNDVFVSAGGDIRLQHEVTNGGVYITDGIADPTRLFISEDDFYIRNQDRSGSVWIQGTNSAGATKSIMAGFPDGLFRIYHAGLEMLETGADGIYLHNNAMSFRNTGGVTYFRSHIDGDPIYLQAYSGGTFQLLLLGDPAGATSLYYQNIDVLSTNRSGITLRNPDNDETQVFTGQDVANLGDLVLWPGSAKTVTLSAGYPGAKIETFANGSSYAGFKLYEPSGDTFDIIVKSDNFLYLESLDSNSGVKINDQQGSIAQFSYGSTIIYAAGTAVMGVRTGGMSIGNDTSTDNRLGIYHSGGVMYMVSEDDGAPFRISAIDSNAQTVIGINFDPDNQGMHFYHKNFETVLLRRGGLTLRNIANIDSHIFTGQDVANLGDLVLYSPNNISLSGTVPQLDSIQNDINTFTIPNSASQSDILSVSGASDEGDNRLQEQIDALPSVTSVSAASVEQDNRLQEQIDGIGSTNIIGTSGDTYVSTRQDGRIKLMTNGASAARITQDGEVELYSDGDKIFRTYNNGSNAYGFDLSTRFEPWTAGGERTIRIWQNSSESMFYGQAWNGYFQFKGKDSAGADSNYMQLKDTGSALYNNNLVALVMQAGGFMARSTGGANSLSLIASDGGQAVIRVLENGATLFIQGDTTAAGITTFLSGDADAGTAKLYLGQLDVLETRRGGITLRNSDNDDSEIFTGQDVANLSDLVLYSPNDTIVSAGTFQYTDGTAVPMRISFQSDDLYISNYDPDGWVFITAEKSGGGQSTMFRADPDGAAYLYSAGNQVAFTRNGGFYLQDNTGEQGQVFVGGDILYIEKFGPDSEIYLDAKYIRIKAPVSNLSNLIYTGDDAGNVGDLVLYSPKSNFIVSGGISDNRLIDVTDSRQTFGPSGGTSIVNRRLDAEWYLNNTQMLRMNWSGREFDIGDPGFMNIQIAASNIIIKDNTTTYLTLTDAGTGAFGGTGSNQTRFRFTDGAQGWLEGAWQATRLFRFQKGTSDQGLKPLFQLGSNQWITDISNDDSLTAGPSAISTTESIRRFVLSGIATSAGASTSDIDDVRGRIRTHNTSASVHFLETDIDFDSLATSAHAHPQYDAHTNLDELQNELNTFTLPNSASLDDLHYEISNLTLPTSASTEDIDDVRSRIATHGASATVHFTEASIDHANITAGTGSDHSDVALNTTHRGSDGSDHSFIDQDVTITGTPTFGTVDASTDFTVGGTVITDNTITDDGILNINATTSVQFGGGGTIGLGVDNTNRGILNIYSSTAGGGIARWYVDADDDDTIDYYTIRSDSDDFSLGKSTNTDSLINYGADDSWSFTTGKLRVGVSDTVWGDLILWGHATGSNLGGSLSMYVADDFDGSIQSFNIAVNQDDLYIGPDTDTDALKFTGSGANVTAAFNVGLTGTTIDATTDFTVGGTVITDNTITDDGALAIVTNAGLQVTDATNTTSNVIAGNNDVQQGTFVAYGRPAAGGTAGGAFIAYTATDHDTDINNYQISVALDDLYIGPNTNTDAFKLVGNGAAVTAEFTVGLTGTTIDASTDFTVGGTVISDGQIVDNGIFYIQPATSLNITGTGLVNVGSSDTTYGNLNLYGASSNQGGMVNLFNAANQDTTIDYYRIQAVLEDLYIGPDTDTDALTYDGGINRWQFNAPVDFLNVSNVSAASQEGDNRLQENIDALPSTISVSAASKEADNRHAESDGSSHSFIDQDVTVTGTPTFGTVDATTDFTVGGTVITNNQIADDGTLYIVTATATNITDSGAPGSDAALQIGTSDSRRALLTLYADNDTSGPQIIFQVPPNNDGSGTDFWTIKSVDNSDDFTIGCDNDSDMMKFIGGASPTIEFTVGLTGTTIDASTDFTVGGTVITDNTITDDGTLLLVATTAVQITGANLYVGQADTQQGVISVFGHTGSSTAGGIQRFYMAADHDTNNDYFQMGVTNDDFQIGIVGDLDAFQLIGAGAGVCTAKFNVGLTGTTIDASTDFTVGNTVITDGQIADNATLLLAAPDIQISDGDLFILNSTDDIATLDVGQAGDHRGLIIIYGDNTGDPDGGAIVMHLADDFDGSIAYYAFGALEDDFYIGTDVDPDMLVFTAGTTINATVGFIGTTIDASTDFTVGGTVITDGDITDNGILTITPTTNMRLQGGGILQVRGTGNLIEVGQDDTGQEGNLYLYGGTGDPLGGNIRLYNDANDDTFHEFMSLRVNDGIFEIGTNNDNNAIQIDMTATALTMTIELNTDFTGAKGITVATSAAIDDETAMHGGNMLAGPNVKITEHKDTKSFEVSASHYAVWG